MIRLTLPVAPVAKARARVTRTGHAYTPEKTRRAEAELKLLLGRQIKTPLNGPIRLAIRFIMPIPTRCPKSRRWPVVRPDIDNLIKLVKDAANGVLYSDDKQVCELRAVKLYDWTDPEPRIELVAEEMDE